MFNLLNAVEYTLNLLASQLQSRDYGQGIIWLHNRLLYPKVQPPYTHLIGRAMGTSFHS